MICLTQSDTANVPEDFDVICPPRSLLVFAEDAYTEFLHGIDEVAQEAIGARAVNKGCSGCDTADIMPRTGERISLTVRRVLRVKDNILKL